MSTHSSDAATELRLPIGTWRLDRERSELGFMVRTIWGMVPVRGRFERYDGVLNVGPDGAAATLEIDAASLDTRNSKRDEHLRSADFFDVAAHPQVTFSSHSIVRSGPRLTVSGDLEVAGKRVRLEFPVDVERNANGSLLLSADVDVARERVGMAWNRMGTIRGDAHLHIRVELTPAETGGFSDGQQAVTAPNSRAAAGQPR
jgi:polyisoprenoid-binding protein YceI